MGRPNEKTTEDGKFSPETLNKLEDAFLYGLSNAKACVLADISEGWFYKVLEKNPDLRERFEQLQHQPKIVAEKNIVNEVRKENTQVSQWYLERKDKKEFAQRSELTGNEGKDLAQGYVYMGDLKDKDNINTT